MFADTQDMQAEKPKDAIGKQPEARDHGFFFNEKNHFIKDTENPRAYGSSVGPGRRNVLQL